MIPSITALRCSLSDCRSHFDRLADMKPVDTSGDREMLQAVRNTTFAECVVEWHDDRWLLSTPLTAEADRVVERLARMAARMKCLGMRHLAELRVFRSEMRFMDSAGGVHLCDVVMQRIPDGYPLNRVASVESHDELLREIDAMQAEFRQAGFAHNNLKPENVILVDDSSLVAMRLHFARMDAADFSADERAFDALRELVRAKPLQDLFEGDEVTAKCVMPSGCEVIGCEAERRVRIRRDGLCGFADPSGEVVIEPMFDRAEDFREGRARVEVGGRCGLIDNRGRYVVEPRFDELVYDDGCGISLAKSEGVWTAFDYEGHPMGMADEDVWTLADMLKARMNVTIEI